MDNFKQFILSINDLPLGISNLKFDIKGWFFDKYEKSEIKNCDLKVDLVLDKQARMYIMQFRINGSANVMCDRCSEYFDQPLNGNYELILKLGSKQIGDNDDIVMVSEHEQHFDITQYLYEYISLLLPMHHVHPVDKKGNSLCNKEVIKLLEKLSPENHHEQHTDPRWDELKKLKSNK